MSKESYIGGDYIERTGGNTKVYSGESIFNSSLNKFVQNGDNGIIYKAASAHEPCELIEAKSRLVGKAKREPGYNFDGSVAEDMLFADKPVQSISIKHDEVFKKNDDILGAYLDQLMTSLSIGKMETVALEMSARFKSGKGGTYKSAVLNAEVANHGAFVTYHNTFLEKLQKELECAKYNPVKMRLLSMPLLNFSSFWDKVSGLGITVHQVWSIRADIHDYMYNTCSKTWTATLIYTMYDHFGLDWDDILKHRKDKIPQYHTGDFFKAWYILQHYRNAKPFITEITRAIFIAGHANL